MFYLYFLTYFIFTSCLAAGETLKYALLGTSYHLTPDFPGQPNSILWKHNSNKVVEFEGGMEEIYGSYKGRITLDWKTAELEITDLRFEDGGDYELEVYINYIIHTSRFKLEVIDKVVKPTISCQKNTSSSSEDSKITATLLCSAEPRKPESLMKFKWKSLGMLHHGPKLTITLGDEHDEAEYSCSVSNPLSSETASFTAKECYKDESSSVGLIVGLSISILLLLLLGIVGVFFCKWRQKARFAPQDTEKQSPIGGTKSGTTKTGEQSPLVQVPHHKSPDADDAADVSLIKNESDKDTAAEEDQMPPEGNVKEKRKLFDRGFSNDKQSPPQKGKGSEIKTGLKNNKGEQKETGSTPTSLRSDSPSQQEPGPDPDIYRGGPDPEPLKEAAEKEVLLPGSLDTEEAKNQGQASTPKESPEEDPQPDLKPEEDSQSVHSVPAGQTEPGPADGSDQSSEDKKSGQESASEQPGVEAPPVCSEIKTDEPKKPETPSSSEPSSSQDQGLTHQNPSDSKEAQEGVSDPAVSGLDEVTAEEGGNSLPLGGASRLPSGGDTTPKDHESDPKENKDLDDDADQSKDTAEKVAPSDQTDSGEKNEPEPADEDAVPKSPGYVKKRANKINKGCARDEQTTHKKGANQPRETAKKNRKKTPDTPNPAGSGSTGNTLPSQEDQKQSCIMS